MRSMHPDPHNPYVNAMAATLKVVDDLLAQSTYKTYKRTRDENPDISAASCAIVFFDAEKLEARYQEEKRNA